MRKEFWIPSLLHLFVDFFCIYVLLSYNITDETKIIWFAVYNCLAFLLQPIIGPLIENSKKNKDLASFGCSLVILAAIIPNFYSGVILSGIGNAIFHVTMGTIILNKAEKSAPLGVFISFGAIGVGLASVFHNDILFYLMLLVFLILTAGNLFIHYDLLPFDFKEEFKEEVKLEDKKIMLIPVVLIVLGVFLRGFFGKYSSTSWTAEYAILYIELAMFIGKFLGGFLLDFLSYIPTIIISLTLSLLGLFFLDNMYMTLIGIVGTNLLMGLTMELIRRGMPNNLGLGFGLLAAFLLAGTYIGEFSLLGGYYYYIPLILMIINSLTLGISYLMLYNKNRIDKSSLIEKMKGKKRE